MGPWAEGPARGPMGPWAKGPVGPGPRSKVSAKTDAESYRCGKTFFGSRTKKMRSPAASKISAVSARYLSPEARFCKNVFLPVKHLVARYMCPMEKLYLVLSEVVDKTPPVDKTLLDDTQI
jgi:hypothetical protein